MKIPDLFKILLNFGSVRPKLCHEKKNLARGAARRPTKQHHGFSLVEVTLAIGIVSFSLLAVVGLLPVGLKSMQNANEQAGASTVTTGISDALRRASSTDLSSYTASFADQQFGYTMDGAASSVVWDNLDLSGLSNGGEKRLLARLEILEPPTANPPQPGRAVVTVAWPAAANPSWNAETQTWSNAEGSMTVGFQFLPR